jgi:hypothetical protein
MIFISTAAPRAGSTPGTTAIRLRPWQQAPFWSLRLYIVVMLAVVAVGFARVAARP